MATADRERLPDKVVGAAAPDHDGCMVFTYTVPETADADHVRDRLVSDGFEDVELDDSAALARLHIRCDSQDDKDEARRVIEEVVGEPVRFDDEYDVEEDIPAHP